MPASTRRILITGGTRGIGAAVAQAFAEEGAELWLTGTDPATIEALNQSAPPGHRYLCADFGDRPSLNAFLAELASLDRLDVCVNNAGINIIRPIDATQEDELDRLTDINYRAPFLICRAAARLMQRQRAGSIINIASIWSVVTRAGRSQYSASKAGLAGMTRAIATDLAPYGVTVNCVSPGFTLTDLTRQSLSRDEMAELCRQIPMGRMAEPAEIAKVVRFLASTECSYLTGQNIVVDGGFSHV